MDTSALKQQPFPYAPTKALEEEETDEYGSYGNSLSVKDEAIRNALPFWMKHFFSGNTPCL